VPGEALWRVPPLATPPAAARLDGAELGTYPAVRLFVERAVAADASFALLPANVPAVAAICRRLDGIPLALEMAAARVRALSPGQIATRAEHRDGRRRLASGVRDVPGPGHRPRAR
jgi:predicted ATPase